MNARTLSRHSVSAGARVKSIAQRLTQPLCQMPWARDGEGQGRDHHRRGIGDRQGDGRAVPERRRDGRRRGHRRRRGRALRCRRAKTAVRDLVEQVVSEHGGLDIFFANAGVSGGWATLSDQTETTGPRSCASTSSAARWRSNMPRRRCAQRRVDRLHRQRRGPALGRGRSGLFGIEGGGHQPRHQRLPAARRVGHPGQRHLPRPDRNRHDPDHVRQPRANAARTTASANSTRSSAAASRSRSPARHCSWRATTAATSTAMRWWSTAACRRATRSRAISTSRCCEKVDRADPPVIPRLSIESHTASCQRFSISPNPLPPIRAPASSSARVAACYDLSSEPAGSSFSTRRLPLPYPRSMLSSQRLEPTIDSARRRHQAHSEAPHSLGADSIPSIATSSSIFRSPPQPRRRPVFNSQIASCMFIRGLSRCHFRNQSNSLLGRSTFWSKS